MARNTATLSAPSLASEAFQARRSIMREPPSTIRGALFSNPSPEWKTVIDQSLRKAREALAAGETLQA
jgi:hypothetical protein